MIKHNYQGWPGAFCVHCGHPDPMEEAMAHGCDSIRCKYCGHDYPQSEPCTSERNALPRPPDEELTFFFPHDPEWGNCGEHGTEECSFGFEYPECLDNGCRYHVKSTGS